MGPHQARSKGQQYATNFSTGNCDNRQLTSSSYPAEYAFEYDPDGIISQQTQTMNGRPMADDAMFGPQPSDTPFDFVTSNQSQWQSHPGPESYYPSPPQIFPVGDDYSNLAYPVDPLTNQDRNSAATGTQQPGLLPLGSGASNSTYRPIAPAPPVPQIPHHHQQHAANVAAAAPIGSNWQHVQQQQQQQQRTNSSGRPQQHQIPIRLDISSFPNEVVFDEHGRTFQAYRQDGYYLPNDPQEQDRLDFQHEVYKTLTEGRLYLAPLQKPPRSVLDLGTGTGIWANEPQVLGTDLTMIQPTHRPLPPNVSYIKEDAEEDEWSVPLGFDFIHARELLHVDQGPYEVYKHLAPGGWIEIQDVRVSFHSYDGTSQGSALERHCQLFGEGLTRLGRDITALDRYRTMIADVGFVESSIREHIIPVPCSDWPEGAANRHYRWAGLFQAVNILQVVNCVTNKVIQVAGVSEGENRRLAADVERELVSKRVHGYWPYHVIYAQKPW
ncbi:S-adenosyl-L-methionine-dependent methyltransferase [Apiospora hydei]|uniref:S-adenosyl-L-methionine-dependent methyltransferase n=1 Tax=Apiospora hydei TaxID=1337664 RepID=A0ABR1WQM4_9PEZI